MEWLVLAVENGKALLLNRYLLDVKPFHKEMTAVSWKDCSLRAWLNGPFLKTAFQEQERKRILPTDIKTPNNPKFKTEGGEDTTDAVFLLSMQEAEKYLPTEAERACKTAPELTKDIWNSSTNWWLRTPGSSTSSAAVVTGNGYLHAFGNYVSMDGNAVRPAMWIRLS